MTSWGSFRKFVLRKREFPEDKWLKCESCEAMVFRQTLEENLHVCPTCGYHYRVDSATRVSITVDEGSFEEFAADLEPMDPLRFEGGKPYAERIYAYQRETGRPDAATVGFCRIQGREAVLCATDPLFLMGSMGSVVGEKIVRGAEAALDRTLPYVVVSGSGGGARMYEGVVSLFQMSKTAAAIGRLQEAGLPFFSVLTHPTMGGAAASFASLGDVMLAEPNAMIGFTGGRVIKETLKVDLPEGFQYSEFNLEHGLLDMIVERKEIPATLGKLIDYTMASRRQARA